MQTDMLQCAFRDLAADPDPDILAGALLIAALFLPELDPAIERRRFDDLADQTPATDPASLAGWLFGEAGFCGNTTDYHDSRNSLIPAVLDRRLGIPITLALVYVEVARRRGIPAFLAPLPGHVVIGAGEQYFDPFGGAPLAPEDLAAIARRAVGRPISIGPYLRPMTASEIWLRMIANLKVIYANRSAWDWVYRLADWSLILAPDSLINLHDRGSIAFRIGEYSRATTDLRHYLDLAPDADDAADLRRALVALDS